MPIVIQKSIGVLDAVIKTRYGMIANRVINQRNMLKITDRALLDDIVVPVDEGKWFLTSNNIYIWYKAIGKVLSPSKIVEIGTRTGYSLKALLWGTLAPKKDIKIWSFDAEIDFDGSQQRCAEYFSKLGYNGTFVKVYSETIHSLRIAEKVDLVHVDGKHTEEGCYHECMMGLECLKDGGYMLVDDVNSKVVRAGADRFCANFGLKPETLPTHNGMYMIQNRVKAWEKNIRAFYMDHDCEKKHYLTKVVKAGDIVLDVGANHGEYSLVFSKLVGKSGSVIAFEPVPDSVEYMRKTLPLNVTVIQTALSDHDGSEDIHVFKDFQMKGYTSLREPSLNYSDFSVEVKKVGVTTIDSYLKRAGIIKVDFLKVDIEGGELDFLRGATRLLSDMRPKIMIEVSDNRTADFGYKAKEIVEYLQLFGYDLYECDSNSELVVPDFGDKIIKDCVAIPR